MQPYYAYPMVPQMVPYPQYPIPYQAKTPIPYSNPVIVFQKNAINQNPRNYCYNYNYNNINYNFQVCYQIVNPPNNCNPNMLQNFYPNPVQKQVAYHPPNQQIVHKASGIGPNNRYEIIRPLKKGGFGQVFLVFDTHINK